MATLDQSAATTTPATAVRLATDADVPALSVMGLRFMRLASYGRHMLVPKEELAIGLRNVFAAGAVAWVAERNGEIVGALIGAIAPVWWSPSSLVASELAWWVDESVRGGVVGVRLLREFEAWGEARGARFVSISDLVIDGQQVVGPLLERLGYQVVERAHIKRIGG